MSCLTRVQYLGKWCPVNIKQVGMDLIYEGIPASMGEAPEGEIKWDF